MPAARRQTRFSWDESQKEWIKSWHTKLRTEVRRLEVQVARFKEALPDLAKQAEIAAWPFLDSGQQLLRLSWKNKFNPIAHEVARGEVKRLEEKRQLWIEFTRRSDVAEAISRANGKTRSVQAERREAIHRAERELAVYAGSPAFAAVLEKSRSAICQHVNEISRLFRGLADYGTEQDLPIIERLLLVHFIQATYQFDPDVRRSISNFLEANPKSKVDQLLIHAIRTVTVEVIRRKLRNGVSIIPGESDPQSIMESYLASVSEGLTKSMRQWKRKDILPAQLASGYFSVLGVDFSLQAKPD